MNQTEIMKIMALTKGLYQDLSTDEIAAAAWTELLKDVSYSLAREAVMDRAKAGLERPTPGDIYHAANELDMRLAQKECASRLKLEEPARTPEEREKVREFMRNLQAELANHGAASDSLDKIGRKIS
jgi:beta-phosphoglucomutase-like phosphatase (HAD superfamily)